MPNGPTYITLRISHILSCGILIDPSSFVNVITEEHLFNKGLYNDTYDTSTI